MVIGKVLRPDIYLCVKKEQDVPFLMPDCRQGGSQVGASCFVRPKFQLCSALFPNGVDLGITFKLGSSKLDGKIGHLVKNDPTAGNGF